MNDADFLQDWVKGKQSGFNSLYIRYRRILWDFFLRYEKRHDVIEDMIHDTWLYIIEDVKLDEVRKIGSVIFKSAQIVAWHRIHYRNRKAKRLTLENVSWLRTVIDDEKERDDYNYWLAHIEQLPDIYKQAIHAFIRSENLKDVAKDLNISYGNARVRVHRARHLLN